MEYQIAAELTPANGDIQTELRGVRGQLRTQVAVREDGKTRLEALDRSQPGGAPARRGPPREREPSRLPRVPRSKRP